MRGSKDKKATARSGSRLPAAALPPPSYSRLSLPVSISRTDIPPSSSCLVGCVSGLLEADVRIAADAELLLRTTDPVSESPKLAAGRRDLNI